MVQPFLYNCVLISAFLILLWLCVRRLCCSSLLFSALFLLDPFDSVLSFWTGSGTEGIGTSGWKDITKFFADLGLRITIQTNLKAVDFLDVTRNLSTGKFQPYRKPNDRPLYVHRQSNHPPNILKNLPASVSRRLSDISSDIDTFAEASPVYDDALKKSGYSEGVSYTPPPRKNGKRTRRRKVTWYNPPHSSNVATNIGRRFRSLINKHLPKASKLHQIFNSNTLKVSYSCMPSVANVINKHNSRILWNGTAQDEREAGAGCNCRNKELCPLEAACQTKSIVYKATVETDAGAKEYTGLTATAFKQRFYNHQQSLRDARYPNSTALSKYVWSLKSNNVNFSIKWSIHKKARAYNNAAKRCDLRLAEKLAIALADKGKSLNRRSEFVSKCRHENKFYLRNYPPSVD